MLTILLVLLIVMAFGGGSMLQGSPYGYGGWGIGGILLVVLIVMLLTGRL